jgi:hypothetical protein
MVASAMGFAMTILREGKNGCHAKPQAFLAVLLYNDQP